MGRLGSCFIPVALSRKTGYNKNIKGRKGVSAMKWIPLPIGVENFEDLRRNGYYFADKTLFIKELSEGLYGENGGKSVGFFPIARRNSAPRFPDCAVPPGR